MQGTSLIWSQWIIYLHLIIWTETIEYFLQTQKELTVFMFLFLEIFISYGAQLICKNT